MDILLYTVYYVRTVDGGLEQVRSQVGSTKEVQ